MLGIEVDLDKIPGSASRNDYKLFSESQGRILVTIAPKYKERFEQIMNGNVISNIGIVRGDGNFIAYSDSKPVIETKINEMLDLYKSTFKEC